MMPKSTTLEENNDIKDEISKTEDSVPKLNSRKRKLISNISSSDGNREKHHSNTQIKRKRLNGTDQLTSSCQTSIQHVPSCSEKSTKSNQYFTQDLREFLEEELKCSICSEMFIEPVTLNCAHSFCRFCITRWLKEQTTCPICRREIEGQNASLVLDRCVQKVLELSPQETQNRRIKILQNRERQEEVENSNTGSVGIAPLSLSDVIQLVAFEEVLDHVIEDNLEFDVFDQCTIN